jgi:hypothetical protein
MIQVTFKPVEDITTYELALATKFMFELSSPPLISNAGAQKLYDSLPANVKRHYRISGM